jgi:hypothetical protein
MYRSLAMVQYNKTDDLFLYYRHPSTGELCPQNGWDVQEIGVRDAYGSHPDPIGWSTVDDCPEAELKTDDMYLIYDPDGDGELRSQLWREVQYPEAISGRHMVGWSLTDIEDGSSR